MLRLNKFEIIFATAKFNGIIFKKAELEKDMKIYEEVFNEIDFIEIEDMKELDERFLELLGIPGG